MALLCSQCGRPAPTATARFCPHDGSRYVEMDEHSLRPGQLFEGRFLVRRRIGQGGMATVYECEQQPLGRRVALKLLKAEVRADPEMVKRFLLEARAMSRLTSRHCIQVFEFDKTADGAFYLVMEFLDGVSLRERLEQVERLPVDETARILRAVGVALGEAHSKGIVHRDVKPDNVFLVKTEHDPAFVKVLDFGIARAPSLVNTNLTQLGELLGTPAYMSPEMVMGDVVDARADMFAVGVMMYEMLAGVRPFKQTDAFELMHALVRKMPDTIRAVVPHLDLPRPMHRLMWSCLAKDRDERPKDGLAFVAALDAALCNAKPTETERMKPLYVTGMGLCGGDVAAKAMAQATSNWRSLSPDLLKRTAPRPAPVAQVEEFPPTAEVPKLRLPEPPPAAASTPTPAPARAAAPVRSPVEPTLRELDLAEARLAGTGRSPLPWIVAAVSLAVAAGVLLWKLLGA